MAKVRSFESIKSEWYEKLKAEGFIDIEAKPLEEGVVIMPEVASNQMPKVLFHPLWEIFCDYYNTGSFPRDVDKWIWKCFCQGLSERETEKRNLEMKLFPAFSRGTVNRSLVATRKRMGLLPKSKKPRKVVKIRRPRTPILFQFETKQAHPYQLECMYGEDAAS